VPRVWVSVGSNVDRERCIRGAVAGLRDRFGPLVVSRVYESEAVGFTGQPFYNLVVGFDTDLDPGDIAAELRRLEDRFGRVRDLGKFAPRTLDLDLLTYGSAVSAGEGTELPRGEITRYAFVLRPLAEVAGGEVHPLEGRTYGELWAAFDSDSQPLRRVDLPLPG
jgi:2-amino-4-hydroxy-6-hydroxymethyldihydropteridine diphosphokinase